MAVTPTFKSTVTSTSSGTTLTLASVAIVAGATIHVALSHDPVAITSVVWGAHSLSQDVTVTNGDQISEWSFHDCPAETNTVTVTFSSAITNKLMKVSQLLGEFSPLSTDVTSSNTGTGTLASSGTTGTPTYSSALSYAIVGRQSFGGWITPIVAGTTLTHANLGGGTSAAGTARLTCGTRMTNSTSGEEATAGVTSGIWGAAVVLYIEDTASYTSLAAQHRTHFYQHRRVELVAQHRTQLWIQRRIELLAQHRTFWYIEVPYERKSFSWII